MCNKKELEFTVFLIHCLAEQWERLPSDVYQILNSTHILDDYVLPCFDVLHTLGREYLVDDITEFVKEKGVPL